MTTPQRPIRGHFSDEEASAIRRALLAGGAAACPRCGGALVSSLPKGGRCARHEVWELHCPACCHCVLVEDDLHE